MVVTRPALYSGTVYRLYTQLIQPVLVNGGTVSPDRLEMDYSQVTLYLKFAFPSTHWGHQVTSQCKVDVLQT